MSRLRALPGGRSIETGRGHVHNLRPRDPQTTQAILCGHPSVYVGSPDEFAPVLPQIVQYALTALVNHARGTGEPLQPNVLEEACQAVTMWRAGGTEGNAS